MNPASHPWISCTVLAVAGAVAFTLVLLLVIAPAAGRISRAPAQLGHWYQGYQYSVCLVFHPDGKGCS